MSPQHPTRQTRQETDIMTTALLTSPEAVTIAARMAELDSAAQAEAARRHVVRRDAQRRLDRDSLPRARRLGDADAR